MSISAGHSTVDIERIVADAADRSDYVTEWAPEWLAFPQVHPDGSLGFGGFAGQMITTAQTVIVLGDDQAFVYFGGRFGYEATRAEAYEWARNLRAPTVIERTRDGCPT